MIDCLACGQYVVLVYNIAAGRLPVCLFVKRIQRQAHGVGSRAGTRHNLVETFQQKAEVDMRVGNHLHHTLLKRTHYVMGCRCCTSA